MEVSVTMRADFSSQEKKIEALDVIVEDSEGLFQTDAESYQKKGLRLDWDPLGSEWETVLSQVIDSLVDLGAESAVAVIWGDDGWYEIWTNIKGHDEIYRSWKSQELDEILDDVDNFMPFINKVRKELLAKKKNVPVKQKYKEKPITKNASIKPIKSKAEYWNSHDKEWLADRKKQWKRIEKFLLEKNAHTLWHKKYLNFHKELFFYGTNSGHPVIVNGRLNPVLYQSNMDTIVLVSRNQYSSYSWLTYLIWYHPKPETLDLNGLLVDFVTNETELSLSARYFIFSDIPADAETGVFAGHEEFLVKSWFPHSELDHEIQVEWRNEVLKINTGIASFKNHLANVCLKHSLRELDIDENFLPNAIGQYLWDHLSYALEHYPEFIFDTDERSIEECRKALKEERDELVDEPQLGGAGEWYIDYMEQLATRREQEESIRLLGIKVKKLENRELINQILTQIISYNEKGDVLKNRPTSNAFVIRMTNKFQNKEFSKPLLDIWDEISNT